MEDRSGKQDNRRYRCGDCTRVMYGRELVGVPHRVLVDDITHPYGVREVGEPYIGNRVCRWCRGQVVEESDLSSNGK
jgi:hypothetical protein